MFEDITEDIFNLEDKDGRKAEIHTNWKKWRVAIFETSESHPINRSYSFLTMIPSIKEDNGAAVFRNLMRKISKIVKVEGLALLEESYKKDIKHFANLNHLTLVYEGSVNGEGGAAGVFNSIQHAGNEKEDKE